jgi:hypothetical protein
VDCRRYYRIQNFKKITHLKFKNVW